MNKKILGILIACLLMLTLAACHSNLKNNGQDADHNNQPKPNQEQQKQQDGDKTQAPEQSNDTDQPTQVASYDEHGIKFKVPNEWKNNFRAKYYEHNDGPLAFTTIEFLYVIGNKEVKLMDISCFGKEQWEKLKKENADAEKLKLGTSHDHSKTYTIRIEEGQYLEAKEEIQAYDAARDAARKLKGKIKITQ